MPNEKLRGFVVGCAAFIALGGWGGVLAPPASAQTIPAQIPGIVATGFGIATVPASLVDVQVIVGPDMYGMSTGVNPTEAEIAPIINAIVEVGIDEADIEVFAPATTSQFSGPGMPGSALIAFEIQQPTDTMLHDLSQALYKAALDARLGIQHIGVRFEAADCTSLQQIAMDAAVADARERAERIAASLGAKVGGLIQATDSMLFGIGSADSCLNPALNNNAFGPYGPGIGPAYDPAKPVQASVTMQITLSFEMISGDTATPIS